MFSVKGWNISASVKTQTAPPPQPKADAADSGAASKKRKRSDEDAKEATAAHSNGDAPLTDVRSSETGDRSAKRSLKQKRKDKKLQAQLGVPVEGPVPKPAPPQAGGDEDATPAAEDDNGGKKKRRRRNKKTKQAGDDGDEGNGAQKADEGNASVDVSSKAAKIAESAPAPPPPAQSKLTPLQSAMRQKLIGSRFRYLNETLYTTRSAESLELFRNNPQFFDEYHEGFARQVESWPENPVDGFAALIIARARIVGKGYTPGKIKGMDDQAARVNNMADKLRSKAGAAAAAALGVAESLPRDPKSRDTTIIDLGCGTGALARQLQAFKDPMRLKLHSFDLSSPNEFVTVADIRNLPLPDSSVEVAVFSLALMGTNWIEFIEEAWRVLKWKGECWVADVSSRFAGQQSKSRVVEHSVGARTKNGKKGGAQPQSQERTIEEDGLADEEGVQRRESTDVSAFVAVLQRRGFVLTGEPDSSNKMFTRMRFTKSVPPSRGKCSRAKEHKRGPMGKKFIDRKNPDDEVSLEDEARVLKPCVYKVR